MNCIRFFRRVMATLVWLTAACVVQIADAAPVVEEKFDVLQTKTGTYTNVTVTSKTKNWILVLHAAGMVNIKIADLPDDVQEKLGYRIAPPKSKTETVTDFAKKALPNVQLPQLDQVPEAWRETAKTQVSMISSNPALLYGAAGVIVLGYLFFCYCSMLICQKAKTDPGILVWIPLLQLIPLLRAAGMSRLWLLAFLVPLLNVVVQIVWYVNIARARGKSAWLALLLALPPTGPFAYLYLAFSGTPSDKVEKQVPLTLETA